MKVYDYIAEIVLLIAILLGAALVGISCLVEISKGNL